jgi:hypothetical protein
MQPAQGDEPDVVLEVPQLRVEEISLEVEDLEARVALDANVLELLRLHVGVDARLGKVGLTIKGVEAQVLLRARLDNVARIIDRVLTTIDENPQIVERLVEQAGMLAEDAGHSVATVAEGLAGKPGAQPPRRRTTATAPRLRARGDRNGDGSDASRG